MRIRDPFFREMVATLGEIVDSERPTEVGYGVIEKADERRITYGVMYPAGDPDHADVHGEYAREEDLEQATADYLAAGDTRIRKQHGEKVVGRLIGLMPWPYAQEVELKNLTDLEKSRKVELPKWTVYAAVKWTPEGWEDVKSGAIGGLSMGGKAVRRKEA